MNTKIELKGTQAIVEKIMQDIPETRSDDSVLYYHVIKLLEPELLTKPFGVALTELAKADVPAFETVRRTRQKAQEENEDLKPKIRTLKARKQKQYDFYDYAKGRF